MPAPASAADRMRPASGVVSRSSESVRSATSRGLARELGIREAHQAVAAELAARVDAHGGADAVVDQVAVREADVGLEGGVPGGREPLAQARHRRGHVRLDAHERAAGEVAQLRRRGAHVRLAGERGFAAARREEVRPEAIVLDEEGLARLETPVELHHRRAPAHAIGRMNDESPRHARS